MLEQQKTPYELARNIEDLSMDAEQMVILTRTIYTALYYGPCTAEAYIDSLTLLEKILDSHAQKLHGLMNDCKSLNLTGTTDKEEQLPIAQ